MKTVGLPYQTVQFQYAARNMRDYAADITLTAEQKKEKIKECALKLMDMTFDNAVFWAAQCEDGEFAKKD